MIDLPPFRPPSEASSYLLRVVRGCNWNRCAFCAMYRDLKFCQRKKEEVIRDIDNLHKFFPKSNTAFIGDSNPIIHKDLAEIVSYLVKKYQLSRVTAYARIKTVAYMPEQKLKELKDSGLTRLHMGLESGSERVLKLVNKGINAEEAIKACRKAKKFFEITYYVITGLGGIDLSLEHAKDTARILSLAEPTFVRVRNLTFVKGAPISSMVKPLDAKQQLEELRIIVKETKAKTYLTCDHVSNYLFTRHGPIFFGVSGYLPEDRDVMLQKIDDAVEIVETFEKIGEKVFTSNDMYRLGIITL